MRLGSAVAVREATIDDAAQLVELWESCVEARTDDGFEAVSYQSLWRTPSLEEATEALQCALSVPTRKVLVAETEGKLVGAVVGEVTMLTPVTNSRVLIITDTQVAPNFRRRSVMRLLMSQIAAYGEGSDCDVVAARVPAHAREPNRYLAKLGFNQISVIRAVQTSKLRARLSRDESSDTGRLVAVRRTLRRRHGRPDTAAV